MIKLVSEICIFFYCLSIYYIIFIATRYVAATSFSGKFIENVVFFYLFGQNFEKARIWICNKKKTGSDFALRNKVGSGSASIECGSTFLPSHTLLFTGNRCVFLRQHHFSEGHKKRQDIF